jgi:hypothetical protein
MPRADVFHRGSLPSQAMAPERGMERNECGQPTGVTVPLRGRSLSAFCINMGKKEGVDSVHTWGFVFGCTGIGLGRIGDVFGRGADLLGERLVRVPPRARVFPVQRLLGL